jgi:nitrate/nitrite-specific signal transduction histidine kinase
MGLNIMQYRASSIGSSFEIVTKRNKGTVVKCVFSKSGAFAK